VADADLVHHLVGAAAALGRGHLVVQQGELDILPNRQFVDQIEALEDEADIGLANLGQLAFGQAGDFLAVEDVEPLDGLSSMPITFSKVDLPQPDGPMMATNSPSAISRSIPSSAVVSIVSVR
jgi:hypothetical protein